MRAARCGNSLVWQHGRMHLIAPAGFQHLGPGIGIHAIHQHQRMHARIGHGGSLPHRLRPNRHAAPQHPGGVAVAQVTRILRQHHIAKTHLQLVFCCGFGRATRMRGLRDAVGKVKRQLARRALAQGGWQLDFHARQVGVDAQFRCAPVHEQRCPVGAAPLQKAPQLGNGAHMRLLAQPFGRKVALRINLDLMAVLRPFARHAAAFETGPAAQQGRAHVLQSKAFFAEQHLALALRQQRRIGGHAHIVVLQGHTALDDGFLHAHDGQAQRQLDVGLAVGRCACQAVAHHVRQGRLVGQRQRLLQRPLHGGCNAYHQVLVHSRDMRRQVSDHDVWRAAEACRGVVHRKR